MENYLLEEGDEREERTAYLYLELKRKEGNNYLTIGVGLRAAVERSWIPGIFTSVMEGGLAGIFSFIRMWTRRLPVPGWSCATGLVRAGVSWTARANIWTR